MVKLLLSAVWLYVCPTVLKFICCSIFQSVCKSSMDNPSLLWWVYKLRFFNSQSTLYQLYVVPSSAFMKVKIFFNIKKIPQEFSFPKNFPHTKFFPCHFKWIRVKINLTLIAEDYHLRCRLFHFYSTRHVTYLPIFIFLQDILDGQDVVSRWHTVMCQICGHFLCIIAMKDK